MKECSYGVEVMYKSCKARRDEDFEYKIGPIGHQERQFRKQGSQPKIDFQKTFLGSFQTPTQNFGTLGPLLPFHVQPWPYVESTTPSSFQNFKIFEVRPLPNSTQGIFDIIKKKYMPLYFFRSRRFQSSILPISSLLIKIIKICNFLKWDPFQIQHKEFLI